MIITMDTLCFQSGISGIAPSISIAATSRANDYAPKSKVAAALGRDKPSLSFWPTTGFNGLVVDDAVLAEPEVEEEEEGQNGSWVFKIFRVDSVWGRERSNDAGNGGEEEVDNQIQTDEENVQSCESCDALGTDCCSVPEEEEEVRFDRVSFSRMLWRVSLSEARLYAQMAYLGNLAYSIPEIKPGNLLKKYGLRFVTSSIEMRESAATAEKNQASDAIQKEKSDENDPRESKEEKNDGSKISASAAYEIAASAASYLHARTKSILPFKSSKAVDGDDSLEATNECVDVRNSEVASLRATADSVTAVVAANEEVKQAFADDLNSISSSPCEWFVCDDDQSFTRFFVIQGSESFASWQANLLFEPVQFEGLDVLVHRGIYEAAKGTYQQMLPEVHAHLNSRGSRATFRFTGHSLGGGLALLVNLLLLIREEVPVSSLLPVITFGAPTIMCGGNSLLDKLGLPRSHVQAIIMHRDIVPRAFSCQYPNHVAELLKAVNNSFRCHPCLNNQKLLYAPMGELLILQPDENFSPSHHLLPSGSGLYLLSGTLSESIDRDKELRAAQLVFLNSPHPIEILSERCAYGNGGAVQRDHDMNSYLKSVRAVIREQLNQIRMTRRVQRRKVWWPLVLPRGSDNASIIVGMSTASVNMIQDQPTFSGVIQTSRESLKRFSRLVASQHMQYFLVLLFPARLLFLEDYNLISLT